MTFCLDSIIIKPEDGVEIKNAIILLHGYGGDGKDISMLSLNWKRYISRLLGYSLNLVIANFNNRVSIHLRNEQKEMNWEFQWIPKNSRNS